MLGGLHVRSCLVCLHSFSRPGTSPPTRMSFSPSPAGLAGPAAGRSIQEQRERWGRKRSRTGRELVQTEQRYCEQLELVNTVRLPKFSLLPRAVCTVGSWKCILLVKYRVLRLCNVILNAPGLVWLEPAT